MARKKRISARTLGGVKTKEEKGKALTVPELSKLCYAEWSKLVKLHARGKCEWCLKPAIDAHHMIGRRQGNALKYVPENGVALCKGCHLHFHDRESHTGWQLFQMQRPESYRYVIEHKNDVTKLYVADMRAILAGLREQVARFSE